MHSEGKSRRPPQTALGEGAEAWRVVLPFVGDPAPVDDSVRGLLQAPFGEGEIGSSEPRDEETRRGPSPEPPTSFRGPLGESEERHQKRQRQKAARHEVSADSEQVEAMEEDPRREQSPHDVSRSDQRSRAQADDDQGHRIDAQAVAEVFHSLREQLAGSDPARELRPEGVGERRAVVDRREQQPREERRQAQEQPSWTTRAHRGPKREEQERPDQSDRIEAIEEQQADEETESPRSEL